MKKLLFTLIIFLSLRVHAEITKITDLSALGEQFTLVQQQYTPAKTLGIFAVEGVVLDVAEPEFKVDEEYISLVKRTLARVKPGNLIYMNEVLLTSYKHHLTAGQLPQMIKEIKDGGTNVIAISDTVSGNFNQIPRLEVWLAEYLAKFDLEFGGSVFSNHDFYVKEDSPSKSMRAVYYNGILSTGEHREGNSKHRALANLLVTINFMPDVILMVDTDLSSLQIMEEQIATLSGGNTVFMGFNYLPPSGLSESKLDANRVVKFWSSLADKLGKAKRKVKNNEAANPYEE